MKANKKLKSYKIDGSRPQIFESAFCHVRVNRERLQRRQRLPGRRRRQRLHLLLGDVNAPHPEGQGQMLKIRTTLENELKLRDLEKISRKSVVPRKNLGDLKRGNIGFKLG